MHTASLETVLSYREIMYCCARLYSVIIGLRFPVVCSNKCKVGSELAAVLIVAQSVRKHITHIRRERKHFGNSSQVFMAEVCLRLTLTLLLCKH